jgi:hypothetical protein
MCFTMPEAPASRGAGCADGTDGTDWRFSGGSCGVGGFSGVVFAALMTLLFVRIAAEF